MTRPTTRTTRERGIRRTGLGLAATLLLVGAACGDDDDGDTATTTAGGSGATTTAADSGVPADVAATVAEYLVEPPLSVTALDAKPEAGKKIAVLFNSAIAEGVTAAGYTTAAAEALGWTTELISFDSSPEGFIEAFDQAIETDPDAIDIGGGWEPGTFADGLARAHEAGIIVLGDSVIEPPDVIGTEALQIVVNGPPFTTNVGRIAADWIIDDSGGTASIGLFTLEGFDILETTKVAFEEEVAAKCPGCKVTSTGFKVTDLGTNAPGIVVSTLQANPGIDYLWFDLGDETRGVAAAIDGAGLPMPKMAAGVPINENFEGIRNGEWSMVVNQSPVLSWYKIHGIARYIESGEAQVINASTRLITAENIGGADIVIDDKTGNILTPGNYQEEFRKLWHLDS